MISIEPKLATSTEIKNPPHYRLLIADYRSEKSEVGSAGNHFSKIMKDNF